MVWLNLEDQRLYMSRNKAKKESGKQTLARVQKEMAKPRVAKSARKKYATLPLEAVLIETGKPPSRQSRKQL
jgi:hypothetical protein